MSFVRFEFFDKVSTVSVVQLRYSNVKTHCRIKFVCRVVHTTNENSRRISGIGADAVIKPEAAPLMVDEGLS